MSHEIREHDEQHGVEQAWHGLTQVNPELALNMEGGCYLNKWDVESVICRFVTKKGGRFVARKGEQWESLVVAESREGHPLHPATENHETLFVSPPYVGGENPSYVPLSNKEFLNLIEKSLLASGLSLKVASMGSVFNRRRVFVSIALPGREVETIAGQEYKNFLNLINSFDQTTPLMANCSNTKIVCNNTLSMNLATGGCLIKHTKNMAERIERLPNVIEEALLRQAEFANEYLMLASLAVTPSEMEAIFAVFVSTGSLSTRAANIIDKSLMPLFTKGAGNKGQTLADGFSSITDYYTHISAGGLNKGSEMKQFQSSEFGDGARSKRDALSYLLNLVSVNGNKTDDFGQTVETGKKLLADYRASK